MNNNVGVMGKNGFHFSIQRPKITLERLKKYSKHHQKFFFWPVI